MTLPPYSLPPANAGGTKRTIGSTTSAGSQTASFLQESRASLSSSSPIRPPSPDHVNNQTHTYRSDLIGHILTSPCYRRSSPPTITTTPSELEDATQKRRREVGQWDSVVDRTLKRRSILTRSCTDIRDSPAENSEPAATSQSPRLGHEQGQETRVAPKEPNARNPQGAYPPTADAIDPPRNDASADIQMREPAIERSAKPNG